VAIPDRQPTGVNQPPDGGSDYPFLAPSPEAKGLLADFLLYYDGQVPDFRPPLSLYWLYGFGSSSSSPLPGTPTPTHARDLVVKDADGITVFDSTTASFASGGTSRLHAHWWWAQGAACKCISYAHHPSDDGLPTTYPTNFYPSDGRLDPRAYVQMPARLRSITANSHLLNPGKVVFIGGYNTTLLVGSAGAPQPVAPKVTADAPFGGGRLTTKVTTRAVPGEGLGRADGCVDFTPTVKQINGAGADPGGAFNLDATGCLHSNKGVRVLGIYGSRTAIDLPGVIRLGNSCHSCCPCNYYARTYKGLDRLWAEGRDMAGKTQDVLRLHRSNLSRWEAQKACRAAQPLRLATIPEPGCRASVGGSACNPTSACLSPLLLRFTVQVFNGPTDITGSTHGFACGPAYINGDGSPYGREPYALGGAWPVYDVWFDSADPASISLARFRVCAAGCATGTSLRVTLTAHTPDVPGTSLPTATVPSSVTALWTVSAPTARYITTLTTPTNPSDPFAAPCRC
jgi:hypothetical protein